ncbi:hypothetical protein J437_LFUL018494 [Ladona fulva]|uniref:Uncharacterized protein n=1 Tax=Ladona fulva TaxID=123851 RepID=A0A8K0KQL9_LADFU|nr:hypothetical protein J437_LFUL018494 [Ladona fulva]
MTYEALQEMHYLEMVIQGKRFGLTQTKAAIASVISSYVLKPCVEKSPIPVELDPKAFLVLFSKNHLWVKLEKIKG